jgi:hypothetical protein
MPAQKSDDADKPAAAPPDDFHKFLVSLATDPAKLGAFIKDPDAAMTAAGLSEADQAVLKSGHPWTIHGRLAGQQTQAPINVTPPITILVVDMAAAQAGQAEQPALRGVASLPHPQGSFLMYPNTPLQIYPPIYPPPQIHPIYPPPQIHPIYPPPQIHPVWPQITHPQLVIHPIYPPPQIHPLVHPIYPIYPPPQIHPVIHPIYPPPQIHPVIAQNLYPPVIPQLLVYTPYGR